MRKKYYTANGLTMNQTEWAEHLGISPATLRERLKKWPVEKALTKPKHQWKGYKTKYPKEYRAWCHMKGRCYDRNDKYYANYGGRGIRVCDAWKDSFEAFFKDVGRPPTKKHTLDRIDTNGDYCPENVRWATQTKQARNRTNNAFIEFNGERRTISEWSEVTGLKRGTIDMRIKLEWPIDQVLTRPVLKTWNSSKGAKNYR